MALIYQYGFFVMVGFAVGVGVTVRWIAPPEGDIYFGKLKIRGRGHTVSDILDVDEKKNERRKRRK